MRHWWIRATASACLLASSAGLLTAQQARGWKAHDLSRPKPVKVTPGNHAGQAPSDAVVLFGGENLDEWLSQDGSPPKWAVRDGYMETVPGAGPITSRRGFGDVQLHVEWASPAGEVGKGQNGGNSGVYFMGLYEVQVLDSYENVTYADGQAAALYGQHPPLVNASRPPGAWQSYDVIFRRPRFGPSGGLVTPARLTVFHNGVLVQDNAELWGPTNWLQFDKYSAHQSALPITLQDHDHPVRFRNLWVRPLADPRTDERGLAQSRPKLAVSPAVLSSYVGRYGENGSVVARITHRGGKLYIDMFGRGYPLELVPQTRTKFDFRFTAGTAEFIATPGQPTRLRLSVAENEREVPRMP